MCVSVVLLPTTFGVEVGQLFARFATAKVDHTATLNKTYIFHKINTHSLDGVELYTHTHT